MKKLGFTYPSPNASLMYLRNPSLYLASIPLAAAGGFPLMLISKVSPGGLASDLAPVEKDTLSLCKSDHLLTLFLPAQSSLVDKETEA